MNRKILTYITFIGLSFLLFGCEKDETKVEMLSNPVVPSIKTMPDLTFIRANGTNNLEFVGTPVDPGFKASVNYYLEACEHGNEFASSLTLYSGIQDESIKFTVGDLNSLMLKKFPADQTSSIDFRIRASLVVDAGTGALGTSSNPLDFSSETVTANVTLYGLPRLDLISNSIVIGKVESALGDGKYTGYVKLNTTKPFTLKNPDTNTSYGGTGGTLTVNGAEIVPSVSGWHKLNVDINTSALTYETKEFQIGLIGDATPNGWSAPDSKMDYDSQTDSWYLTITLIDGSVKFRVNDTWGAGINLGIGDASHSQYTLSNLWNDGGSQNIPVTAGNYTIRLYIGTNKYSCTFTKNN